MGISLVRVISPLLISCFCMHACAKDEMLHLKNYLKKINIKTIEEALSSKIVNIELAFLLLIIFVSIYTVVFSYFTIMKNYGFGTYAWDLGIFDQALWTTLNKGRFFYYTCELFLNPSGSFFGIHFSPILFVILPFYAIHPAAETLLAMQSFILAFGTIPLYKLTRSVLRLRIASLVFSLAYLLYPPLQGINWFDFHVQSFLPFFFFSAIYFFGKKNWKTYFLFITLALMVEEHSSMIVFFIGIFGLLCHKKQLASKFEIRKFRNSVLLVPISTILLAALWYLMTLLVRNFFFPINPDFLYEFNAAVNWSILGVQNPLLIPLQTIMHPIKAIAALGYDFMVKISYLLILFGPLAFKSFQKLRFLLPTAPWFVYALLSNNQSYYSIYIQYPAYVIAFVFIAAVHATRNEKINPITLKKGLTVILFCSFIASLLVSPLSPVIRIVYPQNGVKIITEHVEFIHEVLTYLPSNASIITQSNIFPHVSNRINAYVIPVVHLIWHEKALELKAFTNETLAKVEYVLIDLKSDPLSSQLLFSVIQNNNQFRVFVSADGIVLFKRDYNDEALILAPYTVRYDFQSLALYSGNIVADPKATSTSVMYFNGSHGPSPMFWYSPRSLMPPGVYNITTKLKVDTQNITGSEILLLEACSNKGQNLLISQALIADELTSSDIWKDYVFSINLDQPLIDFEIRGVKASSQAEIYLDYIDVTQVSFQGIEGLGQYVKEPASNNLKK